MPTATQERRSSRPYRSSQRAAVPTVELACGTKARPLATVVDIAIAGDDEPLAVLDRDGAAAWREPTASGFLTVAAGVLRAGQERSAGVLLATRVLTTV